MEKPITLVQKELMDGIVKCINDSGLHPAIILPIVKDVYEECAAVYKNQSQKEYEEYMASLESESKEE